MNRLARATMTAAIAMATAACVPDGDPPAAAHDVDVAARPDWRGIWFAEGMAPAISGLNENVRSGAVPYNPLLAGFAAAPMTAEGHARWRAQMSQPTTVTTQGWGYPLMMAGAGPLQFLIATDQTVIVNLYRDIRHVYTDGRPLPAEEDRWPTVWGESVGRWEGDTLMIETVSVEEPSKYFFFTTPVSNKARYTERIRKVGPDRLESEMTIEDSVTLAAPVTVLLAYVRATGLDRLVHDANFNDRTVQDSAGVFVIAPPREEP